MQKSDLNFDYPKNLIATERKPVSRVMYVNGGDPLEVTPSYILTQIGPDDLLVLNDTKVIKARVHTEEGFEILFIEALQENQWNVLCPVRKWPKGQSLKLPGNIELQLIKKGRPQTVETSQKIDLDYFQEYGELPLPPYIQEARGERSTRASDELQYQTAWAEKMGSLAAPTASLHFSNEDIQKIKSRGAEVKRLCLHVGLGTFLPVQSENLEDHIMHSEYVSIPKETWQSVLNCKKRGGKVWALGSTVTRSLESMAQGVFDEKEDQFFGETDLFIRPGFQFKIVDVLMTNFHQPGSTLIAMVMAFAGVDNVRKNYQWAIERQYRLFSYGDLSVWKM